MRRLEAKSCPARIWRAFSNALRDVPLRELKDLGGWKSERTVVAVYLRPDEQAQRTALARLAANGQ
jgi:hypothetical protein